MEISHWHLYVVVNCGLIIPFLLAKPFSLNKAIAEESLKKQELTTLHSISDRTNEKLSERFSLNKAFNTSTGKTKKPKFLENIKTRNKKLALLKNKKTFHIKSPLKPKKLKLQEKLNLIHKRRNKSKKRDIYSNGKINKKYIPLLRNLGVLFDNLLHSGSHESAENRPNRHSQSRQSGKGNDLVCTCTKKSESQLAAPNSPEKADFVPEPRIKVTTETTVTTETPTTTPNPTTTVHVSSFRPDPIVPLLPTRNTSSVRRDHNGLGERSGPTLHASSERYISGDHGDSQHYTRVGEDGPSTANNEEDTDSAARNDAGGDGSRWRIHGNGRGSRRTVHGGETKEDESKETENSIRHDRGELTESKGENKHEIGGSKTEIGKSISERGGSAPASKVDKNAEFPEFEEDCEESVISITKHSASGERFPVRDGPTTSKDQETSPTNEAVVTIKDLSNPMMMLQSAPRNNSPQVTIFDGYSVARDKNGQNKLSEKTIRYQSKN